MRYLITDSEYTTWPGALESGWSEPWQHREIFQMGAFLVDEEFNEIESLVQLVRPTVNPQLSELAQQLTNVTQLQLDQHGVSFEVALERFQTLAKDADAIICMNRDSGIFRENCELNGLKFPFSSDFHRLRPFLESQGINLNHLSSGDLHRLTPTPIVGHTHDALHDCRSMAVWLLHAKNQGVFISPAVLPVEIPRTDPRSREKPLTP